MPSGERLNRKKGTPQRGVISPLLANSFLHLVFDQWMQKHFPCIHFERYADNIVVHCRSENQLKMIGAANQTAVHPVQARTLPGEDQDSVLQGLKPGRELSESKL